MTVWNLQLFECFGSSEVRAKVIYYQIEIGYIWKINQKKDFVVSTGFWFFVLSRLVEAVEMFSNVQLTFNYQWHPFADHKLKREIIVKTTVRPARMTFKEEAVKFLRWTFSFLQRKIVKGNASSYTLQKKQTLSNILFVLPQFSKTKKPNVHLLNILLTLRQRDKRNATASTWIPQRLDWDSHAYK